MLCWQAGAHLDEYLTILQREYHITGRPKGLSYWDTEICHFLDDAH